MNDLAFYGIRSRCVHKMQQGFSLIEVLVTMVIISLALLGTAGLQAYSMRMGQGAFYRSQAVMLAGDLAERLEANKTQAIAGGYVLGNTDGAGYLALNIPANTTCVVGACDAVTLATYDLADWQNAVATRLPQSAWAVSMSTVAGATVYTIKVSWVDRRTNTTDATYNAASNFGTNAAGNGERFSYVATRTIFNF